MVAPPPEAPAVAPVIELPNVREQSEPSNIRRVEEVPDMIPAPAPKRLRTHVESSPPRRSEIHAPSANINWIACMQDKHQ